MTCSDSRLPSPGPHEVVVQVEASMVDTQALSELCTKEGDNATAINAIGSFVGIEMENGKRVAGMGPVDSLVVLPREACIPVAEELSIVQSACMALCLRILLAFQERGVELGESVGVVGYSLVSDLVAQFARLAGAGEVLILDEKKDFCADRTLPDQRVDLLLDTSGDISLVKKALSLVRSGGQVRLWALRYPQVDFDFYPEVHRRSLKVTGHSLLLPSSLMLYASPHHHKAIDYLYYLFRSGRLQVEHFLETGIDLSGVAGNAPWEAAVERDCPGLLLQW